MGAVLNHELTFAVVNFANAQKAALKAYSGIPYCKAITDFLALKHKTSIAALEVNEKAELHARMERIVEVLRDESTRLLAETKAGSESALTPDERKHYDACMKAAVEREDHYP